jgi:hypothetical protein
MPLVDAGLASAKIRLLGIALMAIYAVIAGAALAGWWWGLRPSSPLVVRANRIPPLPRLQVRPQADLLSLRAAEVQRLESYGWVDPRAGIARIPIERAMALLAVGSTAGAPRPTRRSQ